jgi:hypothetical protein
MDFLMRTSLLSRLIQLSLSKKNLTERLKYFLLSTIFYYFLRQDNVMRKKNADTASSSQAGDDIYPLF